MPRTTKATTTQTAAEKSRQRVDDELAIQTGAVAMHDKMRNGLADLRSQIRSGETTLADFDSVVADYARLTAGEAVAAVFMDGCLARVKDAQDAVINDEHRLGDLVADALSDMLAGLPRVNVATETRLVLTPEDAMRPVLYVCQTKPSTESGGILSGVVDVTYFRARAIAPLDGLEAQRALEARGYSVTVGMGASREHAGIHVDTASIQVQQASPATPVLNESPADESLQNLCSAIRSRLYKAALYTGPRQGVRMMGDPIEIPASVTDGAYRPAEAEPVGDGQYRLPVNVSFRVKPSKELKPAEVMASLRRALAACEGLVEYGTGRVVTVEGIDVPMPEGNPYVRMEWQAKATVTVAYQLA